MGAQEKMPLPEDVTGDIEEVASGWAAVGKGGHEHSSGRRPH